MNRDEYRNRTIDYAKRLSVESIKRRRHRRWVQGDWAHMGAMQRDFLVAQGLQPGHRLLDVGCGPLRAGIPFVEYLDPGHYYGIDINETLLDAGYEHEMASHLRARLPRDHLRATDRFDCDFGVTFDYAIAQSVFTHVSLNHIRLCLYRLAPQMGPNGRFFATFFVAPTWHPLDQSMNSGRRWTERNAFFYYRGDIKWAARGADWAVHYIGDWGHPGGQHMVEFRRSKRMAPRRALAAHAARAARAARYLPLGVKRPIKRAFKGRI